MIILDKPYVSDFLVKTIIDMQIPVLKNNVAKGIIWPNGNLLLEEAEFIKQYNQTAHPILYTNSENAINWITNHLSNTHLPKKIQLFKNKVQTRELLRSTYPDFFFKEVNYDQLETMDISTIKKPFIIKPSVGFFSMGVYSVHNNQDWEIVLTDLRNGIKKLEGQYPPEVINANKFIIEENIEGEEFAVDVYYNQQGKPVILNILKHIFSSDKDVSDRVYITSKEIIEAYHSLFMKSLAHIGQLAELTNFPIHIEYRVNKNMQVIPIEVNPMRFAGWCTTDLAYYAYGINVYEYYIKQLEPDWKEILKDKKDKIYSIVVADIPNNIETTEIDEIDYQRFYSHFNKVLEMRKIDYRLHPVFAFLFVETENNQWIEIEQILMSDLREYIILKN